MYARPAMPGYGAGALQPRRNMAMYGAGGAMMPMGMPGAMGGLTNPGMMMNGQGGHGGAGPGAPPPANESEHERQMRLMHERNTVTMQAFAVLGQILQLGAAIARGGSEMLSIVVGTSFAFRTAKYLIGGSSGAAPLLPNASGHTSPTASPVSSPTTANAGRQPLGSAAAASGAVSEKPSSFLGNLLRSPGTVLLLIGAIVVAEHLFKLWQSRRERQRLEAEERWLAMNAANNAATALSTADEVQPEQLAPNDTTSASAVYVARHPYEAAADNQLSLRPGDQVVIEDFTPDGWCWASLTQVSRSRIGGRGGSGAATEGFIPGNYVEAVVPRIRRL